MKRISSKATYFYKKISPIFSYGFIVILTTIIHFSMDQSGEINVILYLVPLCMAVIVYLVTKMLVFDLIDEDWDCGDSLLFKDKDMEQHVPFSEIINLSYTISNPPRMTIILRHEGTLGKELVFSPSVPITLNPFRKPEIFEELLTRIDTAREG